MTTSDTFSSYPPPFPPPPAEGKRLLRRSRTDRVAAGVSSGLGDYFGVDPVLFRVLFATAAFFGGAGILAYLLAWAAIPEAGTAHAPIDGWVSALRRRRFPVWLAAIVGVLILWAVAFSWWAPGPFFPVIAVVVLLVVFFGRRELQSSPPPSQSPLQSPLQPPLQPPSSAPAPDAAAATAHTAVDLSKGSPVGPLSGAGTGAGNEPVIEQPLWVRDARAWFDEAREASRRRRRRSLPIRIAILGTLAAALTVLAIIDAVTGIELQIYFWASLGIVAVGLLAGLVSRRLPLSMAPLLVPAIVGSIAFGGSHSSLHDGFGQREWKPVAAPATQYRLAFGQGILDLRTMPAQKIPRRINVTVGAGQVKIIAAKSLNLTVLANIHIGQLDVDGNHGIDSEGTRGVGITRTVSPLAGATGAPVTIDIHLADGNVAVDHR
jgi:phage shock protein PspC (stress-responsive transcriptional regulator)